MVNNSAPDFHISDIFLFLEVVKVLYSVDFIIKFSPEYVIFRNTVNLIMWSISLLGALLILNFLRVVRCYVVMSHMLGKIRQVESDVSCWEALVLAPEVALLEFLKSE